MLDLKTLQHEFGKALISGKDPLPEVLAVIRGEGLKPQQRLQIHKNNYRETLGEALVGAFPIAKAFVGADFLKGAAMQYVKECPPTEAALSMLGRSFSDFLSEFDPVQQVPYLADLVRLEWMITDVQNRREEEYLSPDLAKAALQNGDIRFAHQTDYIESKFPVLNLWMVGTGQLPPEAVHMEGAGQAGLVAQIDKNVQVLPLDPVKQAMLRPIASAQEGISFSDDERDQAIETMCKWPVFQNIN